MSTMEVAARPRQRRVDSSFLDRVKLLARSSESRHAMWAYVFLTPMVVLLLGFKFYPMLQAIYLSFTSYDLLTPPRWIGFNNYISLLQDPLFLQSVQVTITYIVGTCVPVWILAFCLALWFNTDIHGKPLLRVIYFFPTIMPPVVFAVIWRFMYHPYGLMNVGLESIGIPGLNWLTDGPSAMFGIILASEWRFIPHFLILYLAGLQNIPIEIQQAAAIDGASSWRRFWTITLPMMKPTVMLVVVTSIITASQVFAAAMVLTGGVPNGATRVLAMFIYETGFLFFKMGRASAASVLLLIALVAITMIQLRLFREREEG